MCLWNKQNKSHFRTVRSTLSMRNGWKKQFSTTQKSVHKANLTPKSAMSQTIL